MRQPRSWHPLILRSALALGRAAGHLPIDHPLQSRLVWLIHTHFHPPGGRLEVRVGDLRYPGSDDDLIDMFAYYYGAFEWWVVMLLRDIAQRLRKAGRDPVLYDIGANSGHHSLYVARDAGRIYAFEPYEPVRRKLEERIRLTGLSHIELFPVGLGDVAGDANYYAPVTWNQGTGSFLGGTNPDNSRTPLRLPVVVGDEFVEGRGLPNPDIIKLDVEGSERAVLSGLAQTLRQARPIILAELSMAGRWLYGSEEGLRAKLYDDCLLFNVAPRRLPRGYRLQPFDFARSEQFLCLPREQLRLLPARHRADGKSGQVHWPAKPRQSRPAMEP